ncbi:hypothetical protein MANY_23490 [Mycolicibacterium anyangense]|uniref:Hemophore-related protein n=1 Tax=Mycolicibacterium anyangense TaxID=1431246 RepID=A0A6N4WAD2_9MYCO|nr:hemophore-related protein [Mycolicibacterium anyangense]BBZ77012.1 hypothetical protein MANY_23490 [Mycolicibacterium anyangense]
MTSAQWVRRAIVGGGLLVVLPLASAAAASADPITDALATTPCSYAQVSAALKAQAPALSLQLAYRPDMQANLQQFLALPVDQRQAQIAQQQSAMDPQTEAMLAAAVGPAVTKVANTCMNY